MKLLRRRFLPTYPDSPVWVARRGALAYGGPALRGKRGNLPEDSAHPIKAGKPT